VIGSRELGQLIRNPTLGLDSAAGHGDQRDVAQELFSGMVRDLSSPLSRRGSQLEKFFTTLQQAEADVLECGWGRLRKTPERPYAGGDPDASGETRCSPDSQRWSCPAQQWRCPDRWKDPRKCRSRHQARRAGACRRLAWCETGWGR
jgi:hypothetical protein